MESPHADYLSDLMIRNRMFRVDYGKSETNSTHGIKISNGIRELHLRTNNEKDSQRWLKWLEPLTPASHSYPCNSSFPIRKNMVFDYFIDGHAYFNAVADAIQRAKYEIFLAGWWIAHELLLQKSPLDENTRLHRLLKVKAEQNVRIYVLAYKEVSMVFYNNSLRTKHMLKGLHPNIFVLRHPDHKQVLKWAHHEKIVVVDRYTAFLGGIDLCFGRDDIPEHPVTDYSPAFPNGQYFLGQDYSNPRIKDFQKNDLHHVTVVDRTKLPRMPWHDLACRLVGMAAFDVAKHFIERWNFVKLMKARGLRYVPFLMPNLSIDDIPSIKGTCHAQLLRSASRWSSGILTETSVCEAYRYHIEHAQHFVYIENQFFISSVNDVTTIQNPVATACYNRILRAAKANQPFKMYIILPLLPGFPGEVDDSMAASLRTLIQFQNRSIRSLLAALEREGINPSNYLGFFALRNYGLLGGSYVTEEVYVHSKLMIVDDIYALIGSANINDRSLLGYRDSELAVIVEDSQKMTTQMVGQPWQASTCVHHLRVQLFREHLGWLKESSKDDCLLLDPSDDQFFKDIWRQTASENTLLYRDLFRCIPDDTIANFSDFNEFQRQAASLDLSETSCRMLRISQIQGHLVLYPIRFLHQENLQASLLALEYYIPMDIFM
jgi:phospholipase D1/2